MGEYKAHLNKQQRIIHPTNHNEIRSSYVEGPESIYKNLPMPKVIILHNCAYIPVKQNVNHMIALGLDVVVFRAGFDRDWLVDDNYECEFTKEIHQKVKKI